MIWSKYGRDLVEKRTGASPWESVFSPSYFSAFDGSPWFPRSAGDWRSPDASDAHGEDESDVEDLLSGASSNDANDEDEGGEDDQEYRPVGFPKDAEDDAYIGGEGWGAQRAITGPSSGAGRRVPGSYLLFDGADGDEAPDLPNWRPAEAHGIAPAGGFRPSRPGRTGGVYVSKGGRRLGADFSNIVFQGG